MAENANIRHRFTVPQGDTLVNEWIARQSNLGFSLRVLIKAFIRDYGMQDATCLELGVGVRKKGRPPKSAQIHLNDMLPGMENGFAGSDHDDGRSGSVTPQVLQSGTVSAVPAKPEVDADGFVDPDDLM